MSDDRRRKPRRNGFKTGSIFFGRESEQDSEEADCLVWNLSDFGALLEVETGRQIPERFRLIATSLFIERDCKMIWRDERRIGVAFVR
jgi:hypothetical protein